MTLLELSKEYEKSASLLRERLSQLRAQKRKSTDPAEIYCLNRRIKELTPLLTEMNALADITENYYKRGYYRDERYCCNGIRAEKESNTVFTNATGIDGKTEGLSNAVLLRKKRSIRNSKGTQGSQINGAPHDSKSRSKDQKDHSVSLITGEMLDVFFSSEA